MALLGGVCDVPANQNIERLARLAVDEHNKKEEEFKPASADLDGSVGAKAEIVVRKMFEHDEIGSDDDGFGWSAPGWRKVPGDDPEAEVQNVAEFAVEMMNQMCNSLFPYELQEVVHANVEVTGEGVKKFNLLLKWKLGEIDEDEYDEDEYEEDEYDEDVYKVEVHKNHDGALRFIDFEQDQFWDEKKWISSQ